MLLVACTPGLVCKALTSRSPSSAQVACFTTGCTPGHSELLPFFPHWTMDYFCLPPPLPPPRRFRLSPNSQRGGGTLSGISERRLGHRSGTLGTWSSALIKASLGAPESLLPGQDTVKRHASMHHEVGPHRTSVLPAGALTPASRHP